MKQQTRLQRRDSRHRRSPVCLWFRLRRDAPLHDQIVRAVLHEPEACLNWGASRATSRRRLLEPISMTLPVSKLLMLLSRKPSENWATRRTSSIRCFEKATLPKRYDNIVLTHVLEHLDDPVAGVEAHQRRMAGRRRPVLSGLPECQCTFTADCRQDGVDFA